MIFNQFGSVVKESDTAMTPEDQSMIMEAIMMENMSIDEMEAFLESSYDINSAINDDVLTERTIVRLDKNARISQAQKMAVFTIAKEKNDPKFKKLLTVWRMERFLESELFKKYGNEGLRRAKKTVNNASKAKSNIIKKAASQAKKQFNTKPNSPVSKM